MTKNDDSSRNGTETPTDAVDGGGSDLDEFLRLLGERRRRYALYVMRERNVEELSVLARRIAAELAGATPDAVDETHRKEVETMLVHADVPALAAAGIVSYDRRTETLRLEHLPEPLEAVLEACATPDGVDSLTGEGADGAPTDQG
ncbi:hypothetical protein Htur_3242 [Haloterrigena turkmenica DSM 5511]|uniref:DUF7344 domain-containing protein n=1 Tax=Haloterrigena turkmenica (strain ATCC 51198 / DSM 5511 / JCM 9101 / NCIMB 13204 / VKM B-1734 / 4k) TaxID=543526 RepID=D2RZR7_HALTV|nr:hypothetical protein [Haloterrigena turkmenica]ADB62106.1 hypothetical protein Htur_3242 [Haloterrigena turkmenica DSM 5511]